MFPLKLEIPPVRNYDNRNIWSYVRWNFTAEIPADADLDSADDLENLRPPELGCRSISTLYLAAIFISVVAAVSPPSHPFRKRMPVPFCTIPTGSSSSVSRLPLITVLFSHVLPKSPTVTITQRETETLLTVKIRSRSIFKRRLACSRYKFYFFAQAIGSAEVIVVEEATERGGNSLAHKRYREGSITRGTLRKWLASLTVGTVHQVHDRIIYGR